MCLSPPGIWREYLRRALVTLGTLSIENVEKWKRKGRARYGVGRVGLGTLVSSAVRYRDQS